MKKSYHILFVYKCIIVDLERRERQAGVLFVSDNWETEARQGASPWAREREHSAWGVSQRPDRDHQATHYISLIYT